MQHWKHLLLATYYYTTLPVRRMANARTARAGKSPVIVLFYHRVADDGPNDWTISNDAFTRHIEWLTANFDLVSLEEAQRRIRCGSNRRPAVSITFDDGYADNCLHALPLLIKEKIPVTYFVAARHVLHGVPFPHDVTADRPPRPNTPEQIEALAAAGVEIGAHTRTHCNLGRIHDPKRLHDEIVAARGEIEAAAGRPVRYFAFPYGGHAHMTTAAFRLARAAGYEAVVSAYGGYNFPGDDPFHLQRIHADADMLRLKNWVTLDPRKQMLTRRFCYEAPPAGPPRAGAIIS